MRLLYTVPERFQDRTHMDHKAFCELSDWIAAHVKSQNPDVTVEESLFMFLDIVAKGNSFNNVACQWHQDVQVAQRYAMAPHECPSCTANVAS